MAEFRSVQHALRWAYRVHNTAIVKISSINDMRGPDGACELTPQEVHGQAAMVLHLVSRVLNGPEFAYVSMQFGRDIGNGRQHIDALVRAAAAGMATGFHSRRGIEKCIRNYCGEQIGINAIQMDFRVRKETALDFRRDVFSRLDVLHGNAMRELGDAMREAGWVD